MYKSFIYEKLEFNFNKYQILHITIDKMNTQEYFMPCKNHTI